MEWYGTLPERWETRKIKYTFSERVEKGFPDEPLLVASQNMGVVPKLVYGSRTVEAMKDLHNLKLVCVGDFVISLRSFQGGLEYAYYKGIISPAYTVMIPNKHIASGYFRYLAKSSPFIELLKMCVTGIREGQNVDYSKLKNHQIPLPPRSEQDAIVRYLDWKVSGVNRLIAAKRRQVEMLTEMKRAVVNEAVKNQAGIIKFKYLLRVKSGDALTNDILSTDETLNPVYGGGKLIGYYPKTNASADNIIIGRVGANCGCVTKLNKDSWATDNALIVQTEENVAYLVYLLMSAELNKLNEANAQPLITGSKVLNYETPYTLDIIKQQKIVAHLDKVCYNIDSATDKLNVEVALLGEYRTRLIADVVTGKIDVRGVDVPVADCTGEVEEDWVVEE